MQCSVVAVIPHRSRVVPSAHSHFTPDLCFCRRDSRKKRFARYETAARRAREYSYSRDAGAA
eukprot:6191159-Pleurochrysis_carterae.AAC.2